MRKKQVVVIGNSDSDEMVSRIAYDVGKAVAQRGFVLITGGRTGVMESASKGASESDGTVIGILPGCDFDEANRFCDIVLPLGIGYARNLSNVLAGDLIISICGGAGTLCELTYAWKFNKRIVACSFSGGVSAKVAGTKLDSRREEAIIDAENLDDVYSELDLLI